MFILGETDQGYKRNYKNGELKSKLVYSALVTDHTSDFAKIEILTPSIINLRQRLLLEGMYTGSQ